MFMAIGLAQGGPYLHLLGHNSGLVMAVQVHYFINMDWPTLCSGGIKHQS